MAIKRVGCFIAIFLCYYIVVFGKLLRYGDSVVYSIMLQICRKSPNLIDHWFPMPEHLFASILTTFVQLFSDDVYFDVIDANKHTLFIRSLLVVVLDVLAAAVTVAAAM